MDLGFRQLVRVDLRNQVLRDRFCLDPIRVEPATIICDSYDDVTALMIGGEPDEAVLGLARRVTLLRRFEPVIR